jgi:hypothetical protein
MIPLLLTKTDDDPTLFTLVRNEADLAQEYIRSTSTQGHTVPRKGPRYVRVKVCKSDRLRWLNKHGHDVLALRHLW